MSDSSGDSPLLPPQPPDAQPPVAAPGSPSHLHPAPRVLSPGGRPPKELLPPSPTPRPPPGLSEALEWLRLYGNLAADSDDLAAGPARPPRSLLPKDRRKFHKFDPEHPEQPRSASDQGGPAQERQRFSASASSDSSVAFDDRPQRITTEQIAAIRRLREGAPEQSPWLAVGVAGGVFLLTACAFFIGHGSLFKTLATGGAPPVASPAPLGDGDLANGLSAKDAELIDHAMAAESVQDYPKAIEFLEQARRAGGHIYGLSYRLASLYARANDNARAVPLLDRSIIEGEEIAASYSLRGALTKQYGRTDQGPGDLEKATLLEPFNARYFFVWGEALRRAGKTAKALEELNRAADRLQEPALRGEYALKVRLTQLELGQAESFADEMAARLKLTPPPVDWLLTAAAVEMQRGDFPAAAEALSEVRALIGGDETTSRLQDVFFMKFAHEKELETFFEGRAAPAPSAVPTPP